MPLNFKQIPFLFLLFCGCSKEINPVSPIPDVVVREQVNLNSVEAQPLRLRDGNFIYIQGGIKGIIVYRKSQDVFLAFERRSPHNFFTDTCGIITVPGFLFFMEDTCNRCTFNWEGRPTGGPCKDLLKQYNVQNQNSILLITNP